MKVVSHRYDLGLLQNPVRCLRPFTRLNVQVNDPQQNAPRRRVYTTGIVDLPERVDMDLKGEEPLRFGVAASQGLRETMEDEAVVFPDGKCGFMYAMVLDGHDGLEAVQWLSENMFRIFSDVIDEGLFTGSCEVDQEDLDSGLCCPRELSPTLSQSFQEADKALVKKLKEIGGLKAARSGSTATVALVRANKIIVANVGDSRLVLCRNGQPINLTTEHRVYGKSSAVESEIQRVESVGGWIDDGRVCGLLAVSRAFGDCELKSEGLTTFLKDSVLDGSITEEFASKIKFTGDPLVCIPDVTEMDLTSADDFIIIATDGLWDVLSSVEAVRFVRRQFKRGSTVQKITEDLVDLANKRYSSDNTAVIVIDLNQSNYINQ
eukprot:g5017.t1